MATETPPAPGPWTHRSLDVDSVFHYTDASGLLGMLRGKSLWASEAGGLNDREEVTQGWASLRTAWAAARHERLDPRLLEIMDFATDVNQSWWRSEMPGDVHVLCASTEDDDANQWRLYADEGRGYAVELDVSRRLSVVSQSESDRERPRIHFDRDGTKRIYPHMRAEVSPWTRVTYGTPNMEEAVNSLLAWGASVISWTSRDLSNSEDLREAELEAYRKISNAVSLLAQSMKSHGFRGENEVRVVATVNHGCVQFRPSRSAGVIRFLELGSYVSSDTILFEEERRLMRNLPIKSIRLGPALHPELGRASLRALLRANNYYDEVEITHSEVPLRLA